MHDAKFGAWRELSGPAIHFDPWNGPLKLVGNFLSLAGAEGLSKLITFAAFAYIARLAGPAGLGYVEFAGAVMLCAVLVVDQGLGAFGAREIARNPATTEALVGEIVFVRLVLAGLAFAGIAVFAWWLDRGPIQTQLLLIYGVSLLGMPLVLQWVFQGHERMHTVAVMQIIRQVVFAAVIFLTLHDAARLWLVAVAEVAAVAAAAAFGVYRYRHLVGRAIRIRATISWAHLREGMTIGLSQVLWSVKMFGATLIVGLLGTPDDTGHFGGCMRILVAMHAFIWLYYFNLLPSMARSWQGGGDGFGRLIGESMRYVGWLAPGGGLLWVLLAPTIVRVAYGEAFVPAGPVLQWMGGVCALAALSGHFRFGLIAAGRQTAEMITAAVGAVVALTLIPLLYAHWGAAGAAMALVAAEAAVWLTSWVWAWRLLRLSGHLTSLVRPVVVVGAIGGLVFVLEPGLVGSVILAVVVTTGVAIASDAVVRDRCRQTLAGAAARWRRIRTARLRAL